MSNVIVGAQKCKQAEKKPHTRKMPRTTRKDCNDNVELPLYESFEEDPSLDCVLCKQHLDNPIEFGRKVTLNDVTVHHFCLLLSSNLRPIENPDEADEHILGFRLTDIKKEVKRAAKLVCSYCKENGASIGCWIRQCRKSFHLPCAKEFDCAVEFTDDYRSYCNVHFATNTLNTEEKHDSTDLCAICELSEGQITL